MNRLQLSPTRPPLVVGLLRARTALLIAQDLYWAQGTEENLERLKRAKRQLQCAETVRTEPAK